jgi:hypothetical protein
VHPWHKFDVHRTAAREDFEILALSTQQDQRSGIAWPHHRFTGVSRRLHNIVHGKKSAKN